MAVESTIGRPSAPMRIVGVEPDVGAVSKRVMTVPELEPDTQVCVPQ